MEITGHGRSSRTDGAVKIVAVNLRREGEKISASAHLERNDRSGQGTASALATRGNHLRVAAEATLQAAAELDVEVGRMHLGAVKSAVLDGIRVVLVRLTHLDRGVERDLIGCASMKTGAWDAAAAAVLDAVGRLPARAQPHGAMPPEEEVEYEIGEDEA